MYNCTTEYRMIYIHTVWPVVVPRGTFLLFSTLLSTEPVLPQKETLLTVASFAHSVD